MGRLILILVICVFLVACVMFLVTTVASVFSNDRRSYPDDFSDLKDNLMAPTGIQKAAYIALIAVLFGVASGWLGGL